MGLVSLLDLFVPPACAGCRAAGAVLCAKCQRSFRPPSDEGERFVLADPGAVVGEELTLAVAAFVYEGALRRALAQLKYEGARRVAPELAAAALPAVRRLIAIAGPGAMLVPVPLNQERFRQRGYNQATLLADAIGSRTGIPVRSCLQRARRTEKQHRLDRAERLRNLRGAFAIADPVPRVAILVDDIMTTTATLEACAGVLRRAGATELYGFTIAREV